MCKETNEHRHMGKSDKSGLTLPVPRIERAIRDSGIAKHTSSSVPVFVTAAVETIIAKIVENAALGADSGKRRLTPFDLTKAINSDVDVGRVLSGFAYTSHLPALGDKGGFLDFILPAHEQKVRQAKKKESAARRRERMAELSTKRKAAKARAVAAA